ncbi:MAG: hypothetical protein OEY38_21300 [Gammaproteobacteria bacterium]|nr:hypothetical protein [Gammaproteobacteria bacterium]
MKKLILFLFLYSMYSHSYAVDTVATVKNVGSYGNGRIMVWVDTTIAEPGCSKTRFDIEASNVNRKEWLSLLLTAATTGKKVSFRTIGCYGGFPTIDNSENTYLYVTF